MTQASLKNAIKQAVIEVVREERHLFAEALVEAMEDVALASAIREGRKSKSVTRKEVMRSLRGRRR
jgi:hypothetical protein